MIHLMIDLEALSLQPNALVLQIGAVIFDKDRIHGQFECYLNQMEQKRADYRFHVDQKTEQWWANQNDEAKKVLEKSRLSDVTPEKAREAFNIFVASHLIADEPFLVWSNGADFDIPVIKNLFGGQVPWKYTNQRCYRTEKRLFRHPSISRKGELHNAVWDAVHQAENLMIHFGLNPENDK